ncbi:TIGR02677 family protein [Sporomusa termitida]|uniref:TIGR02677: family protein n=1 Tax=Sporomusa termitida TaxID=2377 RepID=A0A517DRK1_9FIRM|nr:TIGR02677 family protein [Sporomusa termitida]QDR79938.1 TIGR02677: family protein [Sporomusa termitida]
MEARDLRPITEVAYLTTENAWRYRSILRYFYTQHEKLRHYLYPEELYSHLKQNPYFDQYTVEQLQSDLKQLSDWKNIIPRQETGRVATIEDFKKKKFRYQCTPYTVEIERMVERLSELGQSFGGSLEATLFDRLLAALRQFVAAADSPDGAQLNQAWEDVYSYFRKIVENASDYIAYLKSEKVEERMMSEAFLVYKDAFADYIKRFILGLQKTSYNIETVLKQLNAEQFVRAAGRIADYQLSIPRLDERLDHTGLVEKYQEQWASLGEWFFGSFGRDSELASLERETTETIRRITRFAQRVGEKHQALRSRHRDYLLQANWFACIENVTEAHEVAAMLFGTSGARHIYAEPAASDDMYRELWESPPTVVTVKPSLAGYREKTRPGAVLNHLAQQQAALAEYLRERAAEEALLNSLVVDKRITIDSLACQSPFVRKTLLNWVGRCMANKERITKTETGRKVRLITLSSRQITLDSTDGRLTLPDFAFEFLA